MRLFTAFIISESATLFDDARLLKVRLAGIIARRWMDDGKRTKETGVAPGFITFDRESVMSSRSFRLHPPSRLVEAWR